MYKLQWIKDKFNKLQYKMWKLLYILHNNFWAYNVVSYIFLIFGTKKLRKNYSENFYADFFSR